jgi:hypothetical protein
MQRDPNMLTTSTNRNLLQPTRDHKRRRRTEIERSIQKGKTRSTSPSDEGSSQHGAIESKLARKQQRSPSASGKSDRSQLVDLVVEDTDAEEAELVRARKEGGEAWNQGPQRHFVRTYSIDEEAPEGEDIREGYDPAKVPARPPPPERAVSDDEDNTVDAEDRTKGQYASLVNDDNVWK